MQSLSSLLILQFQRKRANLHTNLRLFQLMTGHLRVKSPWIQVGILFLVFSPQLAMLALALAIGGDVNLDTSNPESLGNLKLVQAISSIGFFVLPAFLYVVFCFRGRYGYFLGLKKAPLANMYILGILCIIFSFPVVSLLGTLNREINLPEWVVSMEKSNSAQLEAFLKVSGPGDLIINLFVIALLPAFCEELFFRGAMQRVLIHLTKSPWAGIIITAILFSALHMQFLGFLPRMFMGIVLGALYWYSGSLWTSILAHFIFNAVQVVAVAYMPDLAENDPEIPMLAGIASGIAVWAILWYYRKQSTVTYAKVYRTDDLTASNQFIA